MYWLCLRPMHEWGFLAFIQILREQHSNLNKLCKSKYVQIKHINSVGKSANSVGYNIWILFNNNDNVFDIDDESYLVLNNSHSNLNCDKDNWWYNE